MRARSGRIWPRFSDRGSSQAVHVRRCRARRLGGLRLTTGLAVLSLAAGCALPRAPLAPEPREGHDAEVAQSPAGTRVGTSAHRQSHRFGAAPSPAESDANAPPATLPPNGSAERAHCPVPVQPEPSETPVHIAPDERVPDFLLASQSCQIFDSADLVGKRPFVVVFFASWCEVCEQKMPLIRRVLDERGDEVTSVFVSLDAAAEWSGTEAFLARNGLVPNSAVAGRDFLAFSLGYDPFRSVPVVVVVGRSGHVVDVQVGVRDGDANRLERALDIAIDELPEGSELTSYRPR
jgi:thiol-disulfide isomerase/thioredoxin